MNTFKVLFVIFYILFYIQNGVGEDMEMAERIDQVPPQTIAVRIDHFSWLYRSLYNMRYISSGEFFNGSGPMIVMLGGADTLDNMQPYLKGGLMWYLAANLSAYMFVTEHRYYGYSVPNLDLGTWNMRQLSVEQSIEDIVDFIADRKKNVAGLQNSKVIVIGGGYAGNLAAWLRLKYPKLINIAIASSAPIQATLNFYRYFEALQQILTDVSGSDLCVNAITDVITTIRNNLETDAGIANITSNFNLCETLNVKNQKEVDHFYYTYATTIGNFVQSSTAPVIESFCTSITTGNSNQTYNNMGDFFKTYASNNSLSCYKSYSATLGDLKNTGINPPTSTSRSWFYQQCTQLGYYQTTNSYNQPFLDLVPLSYYVKKCYDTFGIFFSQLRTSMGVNSINRKYGGLNPKLTQTLFTQGSLDPWSSIGLTQDISPIAPAIVINGSYHNEILYPNTAELNTFVSKARTRIFDEVSTWLEY